MIIGPWQHNPDDDTHTANATVAIRLRAYGAPPTSQGQVIKDLAEHLNEQDFEVLHNHAEDRNGYQTIVVLATAEDTQERPGTAPSQAAEHLLHALRAAKPAQQDPIRVALYKVLADSWWGERMAALAVDHALDHGTTMRAALYALQTG